MSVSVRVFSSAESAEKENVNRHIWFPRGELRLRDCHPDGYAYVTPIHAYFPYAYAYAYGYVKVWTSPSVS